ncbi:hypothetical protein EDD21DRAFT_229348 [Dissophora ornata]|nr:hypothetical protein EDD21DRAFT_229348 [Dissophora ornata]
MHCQNIFAIRIFHVRAFFMFAHFSCLPFAFPFAFPMFAIRFHRVRQAYPSTPPSLSLVIVYQDLHIGLSSLVSSYHTPQRCHPFLKNKCKHVNTNKSFMSILVQLSFVSLPYTQSSCQATQRPSTIQFQDPTGPGPSFQTAPESLVQRLIFVYDNGQSGTAASAPTLPSDAPGSSETLVQVDMDDIQPTSVHGGYDDETMTSLLDLDTYLTEQRARYLPSTSAEPEDDGDDEGYDDDGEH